MCSIASSASCTIFGNCSVDFSHVMMVWRDLTPSAIISVSCVKPWSLRHAGRSVPSIGRLHGGDGFLGGDITGPPIHPDFAGADDQAMQPFRQCTFHDVQSLYVKFLDISV